MAAVESVSAEVRDRAGKGAARESRRNGRVPAVIYGDKKEPTLISLDPKEIDRLIHKKTFYATLLDVDLKGTKHRVLPRDVQFDPVTDRTLHVDFQRIGKDTKVHVNVPVVVRNEAASPGIKRGGVLNIVRHEIEFICSPDSIPQSIEVDLTGLEIGGSIHIHAVKLPENAELAVRERDFTVVSIGAPTGLKAEQQEAAEKAAAAAAAPVAAAPAAGAPAAGGAAPAAGAAGGAKAGAAPAAKAPEKKK
ncbi:50S ribosomal protein L25/general stress protein Ctc [Dongia sedimenti]|uniref:Large ribosomal subunit protein bL25 n=1 Tax=Dongia sedimenti TaxID=3064282 RepID=A0ABU0YQW2_9PROT|nr:50S ribosomal protein L25/general stress protein Ctc [Rhodospirillaceae bacterium R-7]